MLGDVCGRGWGACSLGDSAGERMVARCGQRAGTGEMAGRDRAGIDDLGLGQGQRPGLVEDDEVDLGQPLERIAVLEHDALRLNSAAAATTCTAGTARPSAQGQVMISTAMAMISACCQARPKASQPRKVASAVAWTRGA